MAEQRPAPLGTYDIDPKRTCTRLRGFAESGKEVLCDRPAVYHVDWGEHCGFCCPEHKAEVDARWESKGGHGLGPYCGMPGASWYDFPDGSSCCAYEGDLPTAEPVRAVAALAMALDDKHGGAEA